MLSKKIITSLGSKSVLIRTYVLIASYIHDSNLWSLNTNLSKKMQGIHIYG